MATPLWERCGYRWARRRWCTSYAGTRFPNRNRKEQRNAKRRNRRGVAGSDASYSDDNTCWRHHPIPTNQPTSQHNDDPFFYLFFSLLLLILLQLQRRVPPFDVIRKSVRNGWSSPIMSIWSALLLSSFVFAVPSPSHNNHPTPRRLQQRPLAAMFCPLLIYDVIFHRAHASL